MTSLSGQQKQLIFDYCIGVASREETAQAQELIFSNEQAAELAGQIKSALSPLESLPHEQCPDELAAATLTRLKAAARSSHLKLQQLIAAEQGRPEGFKNVFRRNIGRVVLAAAAIYLIVIIYIPPIKQARYQAACLAQLQSLGRGLVNYQNDNNGQLPTVASAEGSPWWKVGYKSDTNENCSNTRHMWLLVRGGYVDDPKIFICPGSKYGKQINVQAIKVSRYYDFPSRSNITYSFRIRCNKSADAMKDGRQVVASDLNPLFEKLPGEFDQLRLEVNQELAKLNSINHQRRGQCVLFCDGSVKFIKGRFVSENQDDIFTLQNINLYQGNEVPSCETDAFVAP
jgi:hypothetical protein